MLLKFFGHDNIKFFFKEYFLNYFRELILFWAW